MAARWQNYSCRLDNAGYATGANDPAGEDTNGFFGGNYGLIGVDGKAYGVTTTTATATNLIAANAGNNVLLAGYLTLSSGGKNVRIDKDAGNYDLRLAIGAAAGSVACVIIDGTLAQFNTDIGGTMSASGVKFWSASAGWALNDVLCPSDGTVWRCTFAGTGGTTEPAWAGAAVGATRGDGGATWTKTGRVALLRIPPTAITAATQVVSQLGTVDTAANWATGAAVNPVTITVTAAKGSAITLLRNAATTTQLRQIGLRSQSQPLVAVSLNDEWGDSVGITPTIYAGQPAGMALFPIQVSTGDASAGAITLGGALASYFTVAVLAGKPTLVTSATRLPDALAGSRSLTITQTDPLSSNGTFTTTLTCSVVSSQGRPTDTSVLAMVSTELWLRRKRIVDALAAKPFQGYQGQSFVGGGDLAVTSAATLQAAIQGITPNGTGWYRIRLQNGTYEGAYLTAIRKNFGTGGLLIEPDTGHDPDINCSFGNVVISGLHCRAYRSIGHKDKAGSTFQWTFKDPLGSVSYYNRAIFSGMRVGLMWSSVSYVQADVSAKGTYFVNAEHGEQIEVIDNSFFGSGGCCLLAGVRLQNVSRNDVRLGCLDFFRTIAILNWQSTQNVFADNHAYVLMADNTWRTAINYPELTSTYHLDFFQLTAFQTPAGKTLYQWYPTQGLGILGARGDDDANPALRAGIAIGDYIFNEGRIYVATASDYPGKTGAANLTGSGTGIVDGNITWSRVATSYDFSNLLNIHRENNVMHDRANTGTSHPTTQFFSNFGPMPLIPVVSMVNDICAGNSTYGVELGRGSAMIEYCTMTNAAETIGVLSRPYIVSGPAKKIRDRNNVLANYPAPTGQYSKMGGVSVPTLNGAADPGGTLRGTFATYGDGRWGYAAAINDDGTQSAAAFRAALAYQLRATARDNGHRFPRYAVPRSIAFTLTKAGLPPFVSALPVSG